MSEENENSQALFFNFTNKPFTGYWNGKAKTFKAGSKQYMEAWRARHYAKHLTNQVLLEKGLENYTSPKFPAQVPQFMEIFNKACIIEEDQDVEQDESDLINKQHEKDEPSMNVPESKKSDSKKVPTLVDDKEPQIVTGPADDDDDDDEFEGLNDEEKVKFN